MGVDRDDRLLDDFVHGFLSGLECQNQNPGPDNGQRGRHNERHLREDLKKQRTSEGCHRVEGPPADLCHWADLLVTVDRRDLAVEHVQSERGQIIEGDKGEEEENAPFESGKRDS